MELTIGMIIAALVIIACVISNKISLKMGVPVLFAFILLGMLLGSDGIFRIQFEDFRFAEEICTVALIFIMFYGGFGTNWSAARKQAPRAILLSTVGVILTAIFTGLFCRLVLGFEWLESFLIGSVLSSTDAASVFSILRSRKLNLKDGTASLLEVESGSNDPCAYMLTSIILTAMSDGFTWQNAVSMLFMQVVVGYVCGSLIAILGTYFLRQFRFGTEGFEAIFTLAIALLSYAVPAALGGNGYLSAYIVGLVIGNQPIAAKKTLVHFFDGVTGLMQMLVFFLLGLLSFPSQMPQIFLPALAIAGFLTLVSRPLATVLLMAPFKAKWRQQGVVAWAGLRGATSIVFAVMATVSSAYTENDVFHITFCVVMLSIGIQGTLLPWVSKKLGMIDRHSNVMRTFSDYNEDSEAQFIRLRVPFTHPWCKKAIRDIPMPPNMMVALIERDSEQLIPNGNTTIWANDILVLGAIESSVKVNIPLSEHKISINHPWRGKTLKEAAPGSDMLVLMVKRHGRLVMPSGAMRMRLGDTMIVARHKRKGKNNIAVAPVEPKASETAPDSGESTLAMGTDNDGKKQAFFENAQFLRERFGIIPLMYGSLGLEYLTGHDFNADDIDILIPKVFVTERWAEFKAVLEENGFVLIDEHEHTFKKNEFCFSYAQIEELETFAGIPMDEIATLEVKDVRFKLLSLKQYLDVYSTSAKDGYRANVKEKNDLAKIDFIEHKLQDIN